MDETDRLSALVKMCIRDSAYSLLKLLGKGKGGYSYLAQMADGQQVVVKQIHHEPCVYYQFGNKIEAELRDYNHLQEIGIPMPRMLDVDTKAERIVKEYIAGETVYTLDVYKRQVQFRPWSRRGRVTPPYRKAEHNTLSIVGSTACLLYTSRCV